MTYPYRLFSLSAQRTRLTSVLELADGFITIRWPHANILTNQ